MLLELVALLVGSSAFAAIVSPARAALHRSCEGSANGTNASESSSEHAKNEENLRGAYSLAATVLSCIYVLCAFAVLVGVRELSRALT